MTSLSREATGGGPTIDTAFGYDLAGRLTDIDHTSSLAGALSSFDYAYDFAGRITSYTGPEGTVNYTYDDTDQLTGASGARSESYSYDANGNRTMSGYVTDPNNRLIEDPTYTYTYDDEGNRLTRTRKSDNQKWEYTWDHRNRLTRVVEKNSGGTVVKQVDYTYDVWDRRIGVTVDPDGAGSLPATDTWTVYDGVNPYADFDDAGSLTTRYLYGPAVDFLLARVDASGDEDWYLTDNLGSIRQIVDSDGTVLDAIDYDSYGNIVSETNPAAGDRFKYTAREWDAAVDLYFYRARWYDPSAGRFISEDPIGFGAGDPNLSRYVRNDPTNHTDPTGLLVNQPGEQGLSTGQAIGAIAFGVVGSPSSMDLGAYVGGVVEQVVSAEIQRRAAIDAMSRAERIGAVVGYLFNPRVGAQGLSFAVGAVEDAIAEALRIKEERARQQAIATISTVVIKPPLCPRPQPVGRQTGRVHRGQHDDTCAKTHDSTNYRR